MPWCPVCKNEYREGITECAECKVPLVNDLSEAANYACDTELFSTEKEKLADKFVQFLEYSGVSTYELKYNDTNELWYVYVSKDDYDKAYKLLRVFIMAERENMASFDDDPEADFDSDSVFEEVGENTDEDYFENESDSDDSSEFVPEGNASDDIFEDGDEYNPYDDMDDEEKTASSPEFVRKSEQYNDYKFSAYSCMIVGAIGLVFTILNMIGIIELMTVLFSQIVMLIVFVLFFAGGVWMYVKSNSIQTMIADENSSINEINEWLLANVTAESYEAFADEETASEINYLDYSNQVKEKAFNVFPDMNPSMIEALVEEHLDKVI